jgi:hypothetical protein
MKILSVIIQVSSDSTIVIKALHEYYSDFYKHPSFVIEILVGAFAAVIGFLAWQEARKAKLAAEKAATAVRKNAILITLLETITYCKINQETTFEVANDTLTKVGMNVNKLMGIYSNSNNEILKSKLKEILDYHLEAVTALNELDIAAEGKEIYKKINSHVSKISLGLSGVQGVLENELNSLI